jgi:2-C-methyl-D-erythritol 4-phosphate cytidylyltransferase
MKLSRTDDAGLLEDAGYEVGVFPGAATNLKITTAHDLELARLLLEARART